MNIRAVAVGYGGAHFYIAAADAAHTGEQVVAGFAPGQAGFVFLIRGFVVGVQVGDVFVHGFRCLLRSFHEADIFCRFL